MSPTGHEWPVTCPCPGSAGTQRVFTGEAPSGPATSVTVPPHLLAGRAQAGPSVRGRRGFSSLLCVLGVHAHKISFHRKGQEAQPEAASTLLYVCMCVGTNTHAYTRAHVHAHTRVHTHTCTHRPAYSAVYHQNEPELSSHAHVAFPAQARETGKCPGHRAVWQWAPHHR